MPRPCASQALASLNPRTFFNLGMKKTVELADAPEIHYFFNEGDLTLTKRILALPHWIAKQFPAFAKIYERQLRHMDERQGALIAALSRCRLYSAREG